MWRGRGGRWWQWRIIFYVLNANPNYCHLTNQSQKLNSWISCKTWMCLLFQRRIRWNGCYHSTVQHMVLTNLLKFLFAIAILESVCIMLCYLSSFLLWFLGCNWTSVSTSLPYSHTDKSAWWCCSACNPSHVLNRERCLKTEYEGFVILSSHAFWMYPTTWNLIHCSSLLMDLVEKGRGVTMKEIYSFKWQAICFERCCLKAQKIN